MSRKEIPADRFTALLEAGAHGLAAREARAVLADVGAAAQARARAGAVLASLAPERLAVIAGGAGLLVAVGLTAWAAAGVAR